MNVLFLTLLDFSSIYESGIYTDLLREFDNNGHKIYVVSPVEKRRQQPTRLIDNGNSKILKLKIGNVQKTTLLIKGISTVTLESKFKHGINMYFSNVKFDLIIYSTPPITLIRAIEYVKMRDNAKTYLLLKDIFPQNAVDLGILKKRGVWRFLYLYFRKKEKKLYEISDYIGCMSKANVTYLSQNNPEISTSIIEVCPNSIMPLIINKNIGKINDIRSKYGISTDKTVFVYGGNLGKPQGIDFLIECLKANQTNEKAYFLVVGSGTEFPKIRAYFDNEKPGNAQLLSLLTKTEYEILVNSCDVGLIFLDKRFTIPNFPSRLLSYMQASMPILAATDANTDIGQVIEEGNFGLWCHSSDVEEFNKRAQQLCNAEYRKELGANARKYLEDNFTSKQSYDTIMKHFIFLEKS